MAYKLQEKTQDQRMSNTTYYCSNILTSMSLRLFSIYENIPSSSITKMWLQPFKVKPRCPRKKKKMHEFFCNILHWTISWMQAGSNCSIQNIREQWIQRIFIFFICTIKKQYHKLIESYCICWTSPQHCCR